MNEKAGAPQFRGAPEEDRKKALQPECLLLMEQGTGIEPASVAWEATILPMN